MKDVKLRLMKETADKITLAGYERLNYSGFWEWMSPCLNPDTGERWNTGVFSKGYTYRRDQYTGLKDKNGVEIYEGDIVRIDTDKPMTIGWSDKFASFVIMREGWAFKHWFGEACDPSDCEVIGNIHEHKHLLE